MARILAISSQVSRGQVGLSIIAPALQALGHDVMALPTVLLSNHPGHAHVAGTAIDPEVLHEMLDALKANGWLAGIDGILTGYLPTTGHVAVARRAVGLVRSENPSRKVVYLCDPVLGDDPKGLYIDERAANAICGELISLADCATPNRFELSFMCGHDIRSAAAAFAHRLMGKLKDPSSNPPSIDHQCGPVIVATSIPARNPQETLNTLISPASKALTRVPIRTSAPHGTGDLFSALFLAALLNGKSDADALAFATAGVDETLSRSHGKGELLVSALPTQTRLPAYWQLEEPPT